LALTPELIVRRAAESTPEEQPFGSKEGLKIKRSRSRMSNNDRFFSKNTVALATAKIGPKKWGPDRYILAGFLKPERGRDALVFSFLGGRQDSKKMLQ
jgi:hypothetical protein